MAAVALWPGTRATPTVSGLLDVEARPNEVMRLTSEHRADALRRADVRHEPHDQSNAALARTPNPTGTFQTSPVECRYEPEAAHGTTSKFDCTLANGEVVKVKYGGTEEIQSGGGGKPSAQTPRIRRRRDVHRIEGPLLWVPSSAL